ncbi:MAG: hypothetical protein AB8G16_02795 [Gammaproteobacteria bacterium]
MRAESGASVRGVVLAAACALGSCAAPTAEPDWLATLVSEIQAQAVTNPPSLIVGGDYGGTPVYYRAPYCCDIPGTVYSVEGSVICTADGGFTGKGDGRCPDFWATLKDCAVVWTDPRGKRTAGDPCLRTGTQRQLYE